MDKILNSLLFGIFTLSKISRRKVRNKRMKDFYQNEIYNILFIIL